VATAYQYTGDNPIEYTGYSVRKGDIVYWVNKPYEPGWIEYVHTIPEVFVQDETPNTTHIGYVKKPNTAASAADWKAYALFRGMSPDEVELATRRALINRFGEPNA